MRQRGRVSRRNGFQFILQPENKQIPRIDPQVRRLDSAVIQITVPSASMFVGFAVKNEVYG
jgi:hypothetical protein